MAAPIILHFTSAHPMSTKKAVLNSQIKRAMRVSSDDRTRDRSVKRVKLLFEQNGYPTAMLDTSIKNNLRKRSERKTRRNKENEIFMRLPYLDENVVRRVNGVLRRSKTNIKVAWISGPTIGNKLISSAFSKPPCPAGTKHCHTCESGLKGKCTKKNIVYKITCSLCERNGRTEFYIGESTRPVRYRFNEHLSDARLRKPDTPLGEHIADSHFNASSTEINSAFTIDIIGWGRDSAELKITESIKIRDLRPTLNMMKSSWPLARKP